MNWNLLGHEWAVDLLREHLGAGRVRHAYLITGPRQVGRRTLALRLAQALNCPTPPAPGEMCGECRTCRQIERMQHPDLSVVQAETRGGTIKVDQVRELQRGLSLAPYEARYRVALLLNFEDAHPSAANALLKTLEEPPPQVILIVTADSAESLLPTIVSRCEVVRLRGMPLEALSQGLEQLHALPGEQARLLGHISGGRPGVALQYWNEPERQDQRHSILEEHRSLLRATRVERFAAADVLAKDKEAQRETLPTWLGLWRDVMLRAAGSHAQIENVDRAEEIERLAAGVGLEAAHRTVTSIERTMYLLSRNVNARLALEVLMLDLPQKS